ncbi:hypothetical protein HJC23_009622 [Cyclotella cryptica]|uniref:E2F-associated phosphoprotein n=1 Tax=Cyclotella cryptica TaxID=29204 RepID=A0ABD3PVG3_9STRA|eukprot:CCRYP_010883-RA/>CCRYP_010883-RA protein AED:0.04 eAED:0.04 QI:259/-1/1/1/-1/1/1/338/322
MEAEDMDMDAAAIVSETDAAHSSDEEDHDWLSKSAVASLRRRRSASAAGRRVLQRVDEGGVEPSEHDLNGDDDDDDDNDDPLQEDDDSDDEDEAVDENFVPDDLYCANMDDEDEAWVYKHMRSGKEELVYIRTQQTSGKEQDGTNHGGASGQAHASQDGNLVDKSNNTLPDQDDVTGQNKQTMHQALMLKPRNSDAVLSCPRCFTTVCMDCQQHESYANQYRAMFVMNIGVDWNKRMVYDDAVGGLKLLPLGGERSTHSGNEVDANNIPDTIPHDLDNAGLKNDNDPKQIYYSVHCGYCQWEVAVLDMKDEIYYFFGCIASA